jgi:hypothetical protein
MPGSLRTIVAATALAVLSLNAAAQPSRFARKPIEPTFFGINGMGYLHYREDKDATRTATRKMGFLKQMGAATDRTDFWWGIIEPSKGQHDWWRTDWMIDYYRQRAVEPLPILSYNAAWMGDVSPHTPQDFADYADYVRATVARYSNRVRCWEIWNEPNIETFWKPRGNVEHYTQLLIAAYRAAKEVDSTCTIVGASTSMTDVNFIDGIAKHGGIHSMDVVSFHPYSHSDGPMQMHLARQIQNVRSTMERHGRPGIPLWITEMGWQADVRKPAEVEKQARYLVQSHVIAAAEGVERLYWFSLQDWMENDKLEGWGVISPKFEEKRTTKAYRTMRDMLVGTVFSSHKVLQDHAGTRFHAYHFNRQDVPVIVAWAERKHIAQIPIMHSTITDLYGATQKIADGITSVGESPVYIEGGLLRFMRDTAPPLPENLITNPSFEDIETTRVYGWDQGMFYGGNNDGIFGIEADAAHGSRSVSLSATTDTLWNCWPVPALPGEEYTLTASMKAEDATGENYVQILFLGGPGWAWKGGPTSAALTGSKDWHEVTVTGTVPEDADIVRINLVSKGNSGKVLFDNLRLTRR